MFSKFCSRSSLEIFKINFSSTDTDGFVVGMQLQRPPKSISTPLAVSTGIDHRLGMHHHEDLCVCNFQWVFWFPVTHCVILLSVFCKIEALEYFLSCIVDDECCVVFFPKSKHLYAQIEILFRKIRYYIHFLS